MKLFEVPYTFVLMNWAAVAGLYHFLRGRDVWKEVWLKRSVSAVSQQAGGQ